jgi:HlyD family secretion protein
MGMDCRRLGAILIPVLASTHLVCGTPSRDPATAPAATGRAAPTSTLERRDFVRTLRLTGIVEAPRSTPVTVPRLAGPGINSLVITRLVGAGTSVKPGDLLVEFDRQSQMKAALDRKAEYLDFVAQIKKKQAEQASSRARDDSELAQARNAVERARLENLKNELSPAIVADKNKLNLQEAEARYKQLEETFGLKRRAAQAELKILEIQRDRAQAAMRHAEENAEKMAVHARIAGLVVLRSVFKGNGMGEVQEGEEVRAGLPILDVVDPTAMQVRARINQVDVHGLRPGQAAEIRLDAYPEKVLAGRLEQVFPIGAVSSLSDKVRSFTAIVSIRDTDPVLMPDLSAAVDVEVERIAGAVVAPRDAVRSDGGRSMVRARNGSGFEDRQVTTGPANDVEVVIASGATAGTVVLRDLAAAGGPR